MAATLSKALSLDLLDSSHRLTEEHPEFPAGSVLRCYARAVRKAQMWGCPPEHLRTTAEASTRWMLAQRGPRRTPTYSYPSDTSIAV